MHRPLVTPRALRTLNLFVLAVVLAVTAFAFGRAGAARDASARRRTEVVDVIRHAAPAVVSVYAQTRRSRNTLIRSAGSGVLVHPAGYVVTNSHVIRGGSSFSVELWGEGGTLPARVVANLPGNDLALLRIQRPRPFPYVSIAHSSQAMLGETVIAVGNPRGLGDTITVGVVSALGRDAKLAQGASLYDLIQTDASINTGNSGGALLNLDGELLGVVVSIMPRCNGIAFAIPGEQVQALLQRALGGAPARKPLPEPTAPAAPRTRPPGITSSTREAPPAAEPAPARPAPRTTRRRAGAETHPLRPEDFGMTLRDTGVFVQALHVEPDSAAGRAGIRPGDIVTAIDGVRVEGELDILMAFSAARPGRAYDLQLRRAGRTHDAVLLAPRDR